VNALSSEMLRARFRVTSPVFAAGRLRLGDIERAVEQKRAVQAFYGQMAFALDRHFDKSETLGYTAPVVHDRYLANLAEAGKQASYHFLGYVVIQVANIYVQGIPPILSVIYPILAHIGS
jgi:hypothetical protein